MGTVVFFPLAPGFFEFLHFLDPAIFLFLLADSLPNFFQSVFSRPKLVDILDYLLLSLLLLLNLPALLNEG